MAGLVARLIKKLSAQTAVYWPPAGRDGYGQETFGPPKEIAVRWIDTAKMITVDKGEQYVTKAQVLVSEDLERGGYLYLGHLADLTADQQADPRLVQTARVIARFDKVPVPFKTNEFIRKAYL